MHVVHLHGSRTRVSQRGGGGGGNKPAGFKDLNLVKARPPRNQACLLSMEIVEPYPFRVGFGIIVPRKSNSLPVIDASAKERREGVEERRWKKLESVSKCGITIKFIRIIVSRRGDTGRKSIAGNWIISMLRGIARFPAKLLSRSRRGKKDMPESSTPRDGAGICGILQNGSGEFVDSRIRDTYRVIDKNVFFRERSGKTAFDKCINCLLRKRVSS